MKFDIEFLKQLSTVLMKDIRKYTLLTKDEQVAETLIQKTDALGKIIGGGVENYDSSVQFEYYVSTQCLLLIKLYRNATKEGEVREVRCNELCASIFRIIRVIEGKEKRLY